MADVLTRTARQVRFPGGTIHKLRGQPQVTEAGRLYRTLCGRTLLVRDGAILTTRAVGCRHCEEATKPTRAEVTHA